ncbi:histidine triad nucleotide-binding protein [Paenibacillus apiarius]|uniref:Histidine triad nucleotide-binding protein n=1 Tax=Paenibacillus apiarius TaxID=46240 RepID=A0ABT4DL43_9BACL|nr:histidine triad nucleotide-binding protein [Paenibacillus apiarius]MBN3525904.1 histidine triad nucleotide-binding protein [Paenibacillus apiarius]MCY9513529.1 histidine triad nucleotide-binding protein [Paenibacillus apiarius]MCY9518080.1 histidine triad nucleotide-binding protein [Paenibacillus apiarius]MCY9551519.1 histidine triad nucleotide-binding protein [Paenibacillus apiarius]MCY9558673.1 histidine triad nucleotide-binding protein [Paenibacillus apiarius]
MDCIFCKIIEGTIPSKKVYENESVVAFHDITPQAPVHILIIPKKHIATMNDAESEDFALIGEMHRAAQQVARELGIADTGYRLINNCGKDSGQEVFHIHYHLLGGEPLGALVGRKA